jgi:hypothetical protein
MVPTENAGRDASTALPPDDRIGGTESAERHQTHRNAQAQTCFH